MAVSLLFGLENKIGLFCKSKQGFTLCKQLVFVPTIN